MTKTQLIQLRETLKAMEAAVLQRVSVAKSEIVIERAPDFTDDVWSTAGREVALVNLARDSGLLRKIRAALSRIERGAFGVCINCDEAISQKRLAAVPWTSLCIGCQEEMDRNSVNPRFEHTSTQLLPIDDQSELQALRSNS